MKKKLFIIFTFILFIIPFRVKATTITISSNSNEIIEANSEFTLTINVTDGNNVLGLLGKLSYDSSKLVLTSSNGLNGFVMTTGSNVLLDSINAKSGNFSIGTLKFKAKETFKPGDSTNISLTNVVISDGSNEVVVNDTTKKITVATPKSTDNSLKYIAINDKTIDNFNNNTKKYQTVVENNITTVNITAQANDSKTKINGTGRKMLSLYSNIYIIESISESGAKSTYTIEIIRKDENGNKAPLSNNSKLKNLSVKGYNISFSDNNYSYDITVANYINDLEIIAEASSDKSHVNIEKKQLEVGQNVIKIIVTAENNEQTVYTVNVTRSNEIPTISIDNLIQLANVTTNDVKLQINEPILKKSELSLLKKYNKNAIIEFDNYSLILSDYDDNNDLNLELYFDTEEIQNAKSIMDYREGIYFKLDTNNKTNIDCLMKTNYSSNVNLYRFDKEVKFIKLLENNDNSVRINDMKSGIYVLTLANMNSNYISVNNTNNLYECILSIIMFILCVIVSLISLKYFLSKKRNK